MPTSSLVRYASTKQRSGDQRLFWNRTDVDGVPYRGRFAPIMPEEEYEARAVRVADYRFGFFDVTNPVEGKLFQDVMECVANGWFYLAHIERFQAGTTKHYVEWVEYYMEDGSRTPYALSQGFTEVASGPQQQLQAISG